MKQTSLLKTMLLLCALIAGSASAWATDVLSWTRNETTDAYTEGFTFVTSEKATAKSGYYQDSGTAGTHVVSIALYSTSSKLFATTPGSITFTAKLGGGSTKDPLDYNVYACFVDNTGADIAGSEVTVTTKITNKDGSDFVVSMPTDKATDAYGVKIYHMKEQSWNVRYFGFSLSYTNEVDATWSINPASATVTAGESTTLQLTTNYDGTLSFESADEDIATVSYNASTKVITVNGVAKGTTTINVTGAKTATYNAIAETIDVQVSKSVASNCILYESFDTNNETGGNDGTWKNISVTPAPSFDLTGWTYATAYGASKCVRTGTGGNFTSPAFGVAGDVTLKFLIESWGTDSGDGYVDIVGDGTFDTESVTGVTLQESNTRAKVTLAKKGQWTEYTLKIIGVTADTKVKFFNSKRLFLDEVEVFIDKVAISPAKDYTTYVTPFALDFTGVDGLKAFVATEAATTGVTLEEPTAAVPAGTPLVLKKVSGTSFNVPVVASATAPATNLLKAGPATLAGDGTEYILVDGKFYEANAGNLAAGKAYLKVTSPLSARELVINWGETTGINSINAEPSTMGEGSVYDLSGRRVDNPTKGIYIMNGKKVVIK